MYNIELNDIYSTFIISFALSISFVTMLISCICCRKKIPKNEFLGIEGMVKIKNPDDNLKNSTSFISIDTKPSGDETDSKRASNAPHRSLPDIPMTDPGVGGDTNSELYETVDKVQEKPHGRSPSPNLKKQPSVSQHSSLSQADDISSPYARVKSPSHAYDKLRPTTEHPYAQVNQPGTSSSNTIPQMAIQLEEPDNESRRNSNQSLLNNVNGSVQEIPAASAIAGRISASQDLPYMTPPITQSQQHFSGDSQDSSKGYTSISVREPLANIIAQTNQQNNFKTARRRDLNDSHYATVSDDSDEMYAAIDDPNNQGDLYTSGSETYAQIQPPNALTVAVEINTTPSSLRNIEESSSSVNQPLTNFVVPRPPIQEEAPTPSQLDNLKANVHSRQASSSSCTSSVGNLGSPKPEKRQANSPLPPTPKNLNQPVYASNSNLTSSSAATSGRNSVASVIEIHPPKNISKENLSNEVRPTKLATSCANNKQNSPDGTTTTNILNEITVKKKMSPSKDLEGMYAKVMKKNKLSNLPSQNSSPVLVRKSANSPEMYVSDPELLKDLSIPETNTNSNNSVNASPGKQSIKSIPCGDNNYETIGKHRKRSNSFDKKDPGYETIPADKIIHRNNNKNMSEETKDLNDYAQITQKSRSSAPAGMLAQGIQIVSNNSLEIFHGMEKYNPNAEPGYESLPDRSNNILTNDPGYEIVNQSRTSNSDYDPNYEVLRPTVKKDEDGYSKIWEKPTADTKSGDLNDGYSSIKSVRKEMVKTIIDFDEIDNTPGYSSISDTRNNLPSNNLDTLDKPFVKNHDYASIKDTKKKISINNNNNDNILKNNNYISNNNNNNILSGEDNSDGSDIYSSISNTHAIKQETATVDNQPTYSSISDCRIKASAAIPGSILPTQQTPATSPGYSSVSDTHTTTPSTDNSNNSSDTQINYNLIKNDCSKMNDKVKNNNNNNIIGVGNINYESLTGSESDPNYESVKYVDPKENPYELLHNEKSPDISNLIINDMGPINSQINYDTTVNTSSNAISKEGNKQEIKSEVVPNVQVSDYFQV